MFLNEGSVHKHSSIFFFRLLWRMCAAWNSHKKYDFCNTQISRKYLGELSKPLRNNPQASMCLVI